MRESGILLHISSLPSPYGIGTLGKEALDFIDFLKNSNQRYWQVLPIGATSFGDSPYQSFSAFAGNPYFIDLDILVSCGLLKEEELTPFIKPPHERVDYCWLYETRFGLLKKAYDRFIQKNELAEFNEFKEKKKYWLDDYALFMSIKGKNFGKSWLEWDDEYKKRDFVTIEKFKKENYLDIDYWKFIQYEFYKQWMKIKNYANKNGVKIIGDMPIYVALDSVDVWSDPKCWLLDEELNPTVVSGVPPDYFSKTGQLWGNPIYNFEYMKENGYSWWIKRVSASFELFDCLRIDHFRGFEAYYTIPANSLTAVRGKWIKGPEMGLFREIKKSLGEVNIIAEDLGLLTKEVYEMVEECGYPGMKVLQFGFTPNDDSEHLPHNYQKNLVAYTGTHDNMTLKEWLKSLNKEEFNYVCDYLNITSDNDLDYIIDELIRVLFASCANLVIVPLTDYLHLDKEARFNTPSTNSNNWNYRIDKSLLTQFLREKIKKLVKTYYR